MKLKLLSLLSLFAVTTFAQSRLEPGYFINLSGQKEPAIIQYQDWARNPSVVEVKIGEEKLKFTPK